MRLAAIFVALLVSISACTSREPGTGSDSDATSEATSGPGTGSSDTEASTSEASTAEASSTEASTAEASTGEPTGTGSTTADPNYERECQPGDFVCHDWGCQGVTKDDECYKPCTPDGEIGGVDSECDEPERPFCSQVGLAFGGDFDCNGCAHVCMAEPLNWCDYGADQCE